MGCNKRRSGNSGYSGKPLKRSVLQYWSPGLTPCSALPSLQTNHPPKPELPAGRTLGRKLTLLPKDNALYDECAAYNTVGILRLTIAKRQYSIWWMCCLQYHRYPQANVFFHPCPWTCATESHAIKAHETVVSPVLFSQGSMQPLTSCFNAFLHWTEPEKLDLIGSFLINDDAVPGHWEFVYRLSSVQVHLILKAEDH